MLPEVPTRSEWEASNPHSTGDASSPDRPPSASGGHEPPGRPRSDATGSPTTRTATERDSSGRTRSPHSERTFTAIIALLAVPVVAAAAILVATKDGNAPARGPAAGPNQASGLVSLVTSLLVKTAGDPTGGCELYAGPVLVAIRGAGAAAVCAAAPVRSGNDAWTTSPTSQLWASAPGNRAAAACALSSNRSADYVTISYVGGQVGKASTVCDSFSRTAGWKAGATASNGDGGTTSGAAGSVTTTGQVSRHAGTTTPPSAAGTAKCPGSVDNTTGTYSATATGGWYSDITATGIPCATAVRIVLAYGAGTNWSLVAHHVADGFSCSIRIRRIQLGDDGFATCASADKKVGWFEGPGD